MHFFGAGANVRAFSAVVTYLGIYKLWALAGVEARLITENGCSSSYWP